MEFPKLGEKYVCGGRECWCVGTSQKGHVVHLQSGAVSFSTPIDAFWKYFKFLTYMAVGEAVLAKTTYHDIVAGTTYTITEIRGEEITLNTGVVLDLKIFTAVF